MKVYVLTCDDFDEDNIEGVFSSSELADKYANGLHGNYSVDEYELDPLKELVEAGKIFWYVWFAENSTFSVFKYGWEKTTQPKLYWYSTVFRDAPRLRVCCQASNKEDAVAIATKDFLNVKERGRWGTDDFEGLT